MRRLQDQGHDVTVVYLTSGNLALPDEEAIVATDFIGELGGAFELAAGPVQAFTREVREQLLAKSAFASDSPQIRRLKGLLRRGEARASLRDCGIAPARGTSSRRCGGVELTSLASYALARAWVAR